METRKFITNYLWTVILCSLPCCSLAINNNIGGDTISVYYGDSLTIKYEIVFLSKKKVKVNIYSFNGNLKAISKGIYGSVETPVVKGVYQEFNNENKKILKCRIEKGKYHGAWKLYLKNSNKKTKYTYEYGAMTGKSVIRNGNGELVSKGKYLDGKEDGKWKYYKSGEKYEVKYFNNGEEVEK